MGGFECSMQRLVSGRRIDMIRATRHDVLVRQDYQRLLAFGIRTVREGVRWHLIEPQPGVFDFDTVLPTIRAAKELGITVIWDLCHYGWPDDIAIFKPAFVERFARFSAAFARLYVEETGKAPFIAPINEISYFAWAGGHVAQFNPCKRKRGDELKTQLVRAALACINALWEVDRSIRIVHTDPIINVVGEPGSKRAQNSAEAYRKAQFQAWDMISGRLKPELGGRPEYLDILGLNYYPNNQWVVCKERPDKKRHLHIFHGHPLYRPLHQMLIEVFMRYKRPVFIAETGTEGEARPAWLRYVCDEVALALGEGVHLHGICLYPIVNHPGWTNNRHCHNGLWDYPQPRGMRTIFQPLANELALQIHRFSALPAAQKATHTLPETCAT
ncbi:beta-glucosidase [Verrucomicrobia bacterium LW23]|nr:beta-glucosidase [Verrucomicrobia bacterium LW23]